MTRPSVLILGARSDMARAIAHRFAARGHPLQLAARDATSLEADRADLQLRYGVPVTVHAYDAVAIADHARFVEGLPELPGIAICAVGVMGSHEALERDPAAAVQVMRTNYEGPAHTLAILANHFEARGSGTLVGISSVAGARGRATNYVYGSAKAGFTAFLSGLRNRLATRGVHVVTVLPGFVATKMTEGLDLPPRLTAQPDKVAIAVERAVVRGQDVVYVRAIWRLIARLVREIPEGRFKRMRI
jgi:short-subunit dehydrogenase